MANNTIKFDIKAAVDTRGLDEFQSQLGELRSIAEPLDRVLGEAVKSIQDWAAASRLSERNTAAATSAVNALKSAMTAGGNEWKKAAQAGNELNRTLRETVNAANAAKAALAAPSRTTVGASQQIADMRKGLQELTIGSSQYLKLLEQITEREALLGRRTGRAGVIAANQAYEGALLNRGYGAPDRLPQMPDTTAALQQRRSEIAASLPNLLRGTEDYLRAAREMRQIERELARDISRSTEESSALAAARERLASATQASNASARSGFAAFSSGIGDNLAVQRSIERNRIKQEQQFVAGLPAGAVLSQGYGAPIGPEVSAQSTSALQQRYQDLSQSLGNVTRGSESYLRIAREMSAIERELAKDLTGTTQAIRQRSSATQAKIDAVRAYNEQSIRDRVAAGDMSVAERRRTAFGDVPQAMRTESGTFIAPPFQSSGYAGMGTMYPKPIGPQTPLEFWGSRISSGAMQGPAAPSELFRSIGGIDTAGASAKLQTLGRSYEQVAQQIRETAQAAGGSTRALEAERRAWEQLRGAIDPATNQYRQAGREIERIDRRLGNSTRGERFLESAGAISAGAFFGGPEGLIGGLAGMAIGGPGAALGGASIGAQVGIVRKSIGDAATYSAEIGKLRIALKGVVGDTEEYNKALGVVSSVSKSLNIPVQEATQGFTRLAAAVVGAGGNVGDAEVVFKGVTSAIKATGGSSQDAQSAVLALSQVFSKGKVSAEELQGQLGERLPGAVTLFAQATGRTLPQLSKDLEQGTVGLNDLMRFTELLSSKYAANALAIARSTEDSGARQALALSNLREEFGKTFMPLGAALQDGASSWAEYTTSVLSNINKIIQRYEILKGVLNIGGTALLGATPVIGPLVAGMSIGGQKNQSPQGRLANAGSTTMYSDAQGNVYDAATGKLLLSNGKANTNFADPKSDKSDEKARKAAEREERKRLNEAAQKQRLELQLYNDRIRLDEQRAENAIRLEDRIFQHRQELMRRERDQQLQLDQLRQQTLITSLSPEGRAAAGPIQELLQRLQGVNQERQSLQDQLAAARQDLTSAQKRAANAQLFGSMYRTEDSAATAVGGGSAIFGSTGNVKNAPGWVHGHFQTNTGTLQSLINDTLPVVKGLIQQGTPAELANGQRFSRGMSDEQIINLLRKGAVLHSHSGDGRSIDIFVPAGTRVPGAVLDVQGPSGRGGITGILPGSGSSWVGHLDPASRSTAAGVAITTTTLANGNEIRTPGAAAAALRAASSAGDVEEAAARVKSLEELIKLGDTFNKQQADQSVLLAVTQGTQSLRDQDQALRDNYEEWQIRNRLELENVKPELIEFEINKTRVLKEQSRAMEDIARLSKEFQPAFDKIGRGDEFRRFIADRTAGVQQNTASILATQQQFASAQADPFSEWQRKMNALGQSTRDFNDTLKLGMSLSDQFTGNLANGFSTAASAIVTGNGSIQQSFADLFNNIAKMFLDTIARVLADQATSFLLDLLKPAVSSIAPGPVAVANGIVPRAGFMGPGFATGGISAGPTSGYPVMLHGTEAVIPLPNGRAVPVEMKGSGGTSVVVNVNMSTGESSVSSNERDGQLLGKALSEAVQAELIRAELIRQKRPGGILYA